MDNAVLLVQAYLRVNGYFTVSEYPVIEAIGANRYQEATDLDILAFRFSGAGRLLVREGSGQAGDHLSFPPDPALGADPSVADMIVGEVKEGTAAFNPGAQRISVLEAALVRFGCCPLRRVDSVVQSLLRHGRADTPAGHYIRLVAFGTEIDEEETVPYLRISLGHVVRFLREHVRRHWHIWRHVHFRDPVLGLLAIVEKAMRAEGREPGT